MICEHCEKTFSSSTNRNTHINLCHTEEMAKNVNCKVCGKSFVRACDLGNHMSSHKKHKKTNFNCSQCCIGFVTIGAFDKHLKKTL